MTSFLSEVAEHLYSKYGDEISNLNIIFPSRRARLFFVDALSRIAKRPVWQPRWVSIDEMMSRAAGVEVADRVMLIAELYRIYATYHNEPFDKFYFWGEILLADFDMVDKYLIDADMLFRNISDIKELDGDLSYLTPQQLEIVKSFWRAMGKEDSNSSAEKHKFLEVWRSLNPIYHKFRERLHQLGIAYTGMVHRYAVEQLASKNYSFEGSGDYAIIGFNALSECEKRLIAELKSTNEVDLFWDYDDYYRLSDEQESGLFIRENINLFPPVDCTTHNNMESPKDIEVVSCASNILQCKYTSNIIEQIQASGRPIDKNTAIVLTNESLLLPLLYSLPQSVGKVNVTMGYPLRESLAYSFLERIIELQHHSRKGGTQFYHIDVVGILTHPYISSHDPKLCGQLRGEIINKRMISVEANFLHQSELLTTIFQGKGDWITMSKYLNSVISAVVAQPYSGDDKRERDEFLSFISSHIITLHNSIEACKIEMSIPIYVSLLRRHIQNLRIPFEGEPLEGIQIMGILETRNLDFDNVIILSMSDDNFPGNLMSKPSFIPYNLRAAYALPTPEHHEGVYAYYFYRLLQRAKNVWLVYNSHADDKSSGEPSRYIYQLDYESPFQLKRMSVGVDVNLIESEGIEVKKEGRIAEQLRKFVDPESPTTISPTELSRYVACPLRFYFYSLAGIKRDEDLSEGVDAPMFGIILHEATEKLYRPLIDNPDFASALRESTKNIESIVENAINKHFLQKEGVRSSDYSGNILLIKEVVCKYIRDGVAAYDLSNPNFTIKGVEEKKFHNFMLPDGRSVRFKGVLDRLDEMADGSLRIVDYKSGSAKLEFNGIESLFEGDGKERMSNVIQTLIYSMMLHREKRRRVTPALYYVRSLNNNDYSPYLIDCAGQGSATAEGDEKKKRQKKERCEVLSYADYSAQFEEQISKTLMELLDESVPFKQCDADSGSCTYCDYKTICRRETIKTDK